LIREKLNLWNKSNENIIELCSVVVNTPDSYTGYSRYEFQLGDQLCQEIFLGFPQFLQVKHQDSIVKYITMLLSVSFLMTHNNPNISHYITYAVNKV
jgi:hypothetical protein